MSHIYERLLKETGLNKNQLEAQLGLGRDTIKKGIQRDSRVMPTTLQKIQETFPNFDLSDTPGPAAPSYKLPAFLQSHIIKVVSSAVADAVPSLADEIRKLDELRRDGIVTDAEFKTCKKVAILRHGHGGK